MKRLLLWGDARGGIEVRLGSPLFVAIDDAGKAARMGICGRGRVRGRRGRVSGVMDYEIDLRPASGVMVHH